jgi:hypothetical protein
VKTKDAKGRVTTPVLYPLPHLCIPVAFAFQRSEWRSDEQGWDLRRAFPRFLPADALAFECGCDCLNMALFADHRIGLEAQLRPDKASHYRRRWGSADRRVCGVHSDCRGSKRRLVSPMDCAPRFLHLWGRLDGVWIGEDAGAPGIGGSMTRCVPKFLILRLRIGRLAQRVTEHMSCEGTRLLTQTKSDPIWMSSSRLVEFNFACEIYSVRGLGANAETGKTRGDGKGYIPPCGDSSERKIQSSASENALWWSMYLLVDQSRFFLLLRLSSFYPI